MSTMLRPAIGRITRRLDEDDERLYPSSDGKPMAESDAHVALIGETIGKLQRYFRHREIQAYVAGNNFIYYQPRPSRQYISPDTYVVFGVEQRTRKSYFTWLEGDRTPNVVFEFTSNKTKTKDTGSKRQLYQDELEVDEYFLYDPTADYIKARLSGFRRIAGVYQELELIDGRMKSERLGLTLECDGERLNLYDTRTGDKLLSAAELDALVAEERERADDERERADKERKRRIASDARADLEREQRIASDARADALEAEIEALRRRIAT